MEQFSKLPTGSCLLCFNSGSSSLKFAAYAGQDDDKVRELARGAAEGIGFTSGRLWLEQYDDESRRDRSLTFANHSDAVDAVLECVATAALPTIAAIGHRVVHGGVDFSQSVQLDQQVTDLLRKLIPLAPLHLPHELAVIDIAQEKFPRLPHVACFDTAFFRSLPEIAQRYPLPSKFWQEGVRRYGFHGLSYQYMVQFHLQATSGRAIVAHLGNGCSMTALREGSPLDTTMGFTPAGGLMMSTRTGDLDPGLLVYLMDHYGFGPREIERLVNHQSGLRGIADAADLESLLAVRDQDPRADLAIRMFCYGIRKQVGAWSAVLGGLDNLVFTAGIGEHSPDVRSEVCQGLDYLGIDLDDAANRSNASRIDKPGRGCKVHVIPTQEEIVMARDVLRVIAGKRTK